MLAPYYHPMIMGEVLVGHQTVDFEISHQPLLALMFLNIRMFPLLITVQTNRNYLIISMEKHYSLKQDDIEAER
jgi:hypothetical protein